LPGSCDQPVALRGCLPETVRSEERIRGHADRRERGAGAFGHVEQRMATVGEVQNPTALVAGASGGIGRAIAFGLLGAGVEVFMLGRSMARLAQPPASPNAQGKCHFVVADLTDSNAPKRVAADLWPRGGLDVLVLSSGIYERSREPAVFSRQIAANLVGPYALIQQLRPLLIQAKGQVVFINSTQGLKAAAGVGQYAATKHAMKAVADSLREEINADGVRVTSVFLGRTATELQCAIFALEGRPYPPERLIQPADVADLVLSLLRLPRTSEVTDIVMRQMQKT
jgi:NAD(P)-dependent dehydrogenase (short-subunit alcohol dehydrogenase family)